MNNKKWELLKKQFEKPTSVLEIPLDSSTGISLFMKREELNHDEIQGNKWRKLKFNLEHYFIARDYDGIISFGGAFSNHCTALSSLCSALDIPLQIFIRGSIDEQNPSIQFMNSKKAHLVPITRVEYAKRNEASFISSLQFENPNKLIIPEGGSNSFAFKGVGELADEIIGQFGTSLDIIALSAGTGATAIGLMKKFKRHNYFPKIYIFHSFKSNFLADVIKDQVNYHDWELINHYNFGGYGKVKRNLISFINGFKESYGVSLEPIYTGKMMYGLLDLIANSHFTKPIQILAIHTGGLQGIMGCNYLYGKKYGLINGN